MSEYTEDEYLMLSGIQHFAFCRRQWALIHLEGLWQENLRTTEGKILHERCHDDAQVEKRGEVLICRDMRIFSRSMGISGASDVVEFYQVQDGATLAGRDGQWQPYPVEYKHGEAKQDDIDILQLCAQAMCLEEMFCCSVPEGAMFYEKTHRRQKVEFSDALREQVREDFQEMHRIFRRGQTPMVKRRKSCNACSLKELCLPQILKKPSVAAYYQAHFGEE